MAKIVRKSSNAFINTFLLKSERIHEQKWRKKQRDFFFRNLRLRSVSFSSFFLGLLLVFATFLFDDSLSRTYWSLEFELIFSLVSCCWLCTLFVLIIFVIYPICQWKLRRSRFNENLVFMNDCTLDPLANESKVNKVKY